MSPIAIPSPSNPVLSCAWVVLALTLWGGVAKAQHGTAMDLPTFDPATAISDKRGSAVPANLRFVDENGQAVQLSKYLSGDRPVILNLGYYTCPGTCGPVMQGLVDAMSELTLQIGQDYEVLSISIDPKEQPTLAREKKNSYLRLYDIPRAEQHWHFLTGGEEQIRAVTGAVGYGYQWNPFGKVYDHGAGIFVLSSSGKLSQTLYGVAYSPRDLRLALVEASEGRVGSLLDRILLSCYGYDPVSKQYTVMVWTVVRIGGALTVAALATMLFVLWRRERRRVAVATP